MYEIFYNFRAEPFRLSPDHRFCYEHKGYGKARAYMAYAFKRAEGFVMITGRPGTGKTTLIGELVESLSRDRVVTANLVCTQLEADDLLKSVAYSFGIGSAEYDKAELLQRLTVLLHRWHREGRRALLIVDEAQDLSASAMEELRLLTNIQSSGQPLLQIFLLGQPELRDLILSPAMEQVHQRIVAASHIEGLGEEETEAYVVHRLRVVGWLGDPAIDRSIFPLIHKFSEGVPRRINLICSRLFLLGSVEQRHTIELDDLRVVIGELQAESLAAGTGFSPDDFVSAGDPQWVPVPESTAPQLRDIADSPGAVAIDEAVDSRDEAKKKETPSLEPLTTPAPLRTDPNWVTTEPTATPRPAEARVGRDAVDALRLSSTAPPTGASLRATPVTPRGIKVTDPATAWQRAIILIALILVVILAALLYRSRSTTEDPWSHLVTENPSPDVVPGGDLAAIAHTESWSSADGAPARMDQPVAASGNAGSREPEPIAEPVTEAPIEDDLPSAGIADRDGPVPDPESDVEPFAPEDDPFVLDGEIEPSPALAREGLGAQTPESIGIADVETDLRPEQSLVEDEPGAHRGVLVALGDNRHDDSRAGEGAVGNILISFAFDSDELSADSHVALDQVAEKLLEVPERAASITGFTDSRGDVKYNLALSRKRARAVERYLVNAGVERERLRVEGRGVLDEPLAGLQHDGEDVLEPFRVVRITLDSRE